jgi:hypothetical protein
MDYTQEHLDELKANIARGVTSVQIGNERADFDTLEAMQKRVRMIEQEMGLRPKPRARVHRPFTSTGF